MATVQITIPDALIPRITAAARALFPQYASLSDAAAFKQITADYWRSILANRESGTAATTAASTAATDSAGIG